MKSKTNRFLSLIVSIVITALLLTGAVPSFAWTAEAKQKDPKPYDGFGQDLICEDIRQGLPVRSQFLKHGFAV